MNPKFRALVILGVIVVAATSLYFLMQDGPGPCRKIRIACEEKGFRFGSTPQERKEFMETCFRPVVRGETIAGVSVNQADIAACKERQGRRRRGNRNNNNRQQNEDASDPAAKDEKDE